MKMNLLKGVVGAAVLVFFSFAGITGVHAQSKTAKCESVAKADKLYADAIDAHDKKAAAKLIGKEGAFKGTVTKLFTPKSGTILILNFDSDYKTAMTAVLKKSDFGKFPDMEQLEGKEIVVSGKFIDFHDSPEIELKDPKQIAIVK